MSYAKKPRTVSVGTTEVLLSGSAETSGTRFRNLGAGTIYLGDANVAASGANLGWAVATGTTFPADGSEFRGSGAIYAISASGSNDVLVWEHVG